MLDPQTYKISEGLAKASLPTWRIAQPHHVDHFEKVGFPVRINSIRDVGPLIDTMQENRFEPYMRELGGLTPDEYALILDACHQAVLLQLIYLPNRQPVLPISTLLSSFCLFKKMLGYDGNVRSVLEIGPGCGYLSFFLRRHASLRNYSQIEACESFYILQNLVNVHCFGHGLEERAFMPRETVLSDNFAQWNPATEFTPTVRIAAPQPRCTHYPWWRIGELASRELKFQIVTSNANLNEFTEGAQDEYFALIHRVLAASGVFLVQCTGQTAHGTLQTVLDKLWNVGFALLALIQGEAVSPPPQLGKKPDLATQLKGKDTVSDATPFTVNNALFVRSGHPLFEAYRNRGNFRMGFIGNELLVDKVFFARPAQRKMYSMSQFVEDTEASFENDGAESLPQFDAKILGVPLSVENP